MKITALYIYPVKSMAGIALQSSELLRAGLQYDRKWMAVEPSGKFMTQRSHPQMALIETSIQDSQLCLSTFGMNSHLVSNLDNSANRIQTDVWGDKINGVAHSAETSEWLTQALGTPCKLISFPTNEPRKCDPTLSSEGDNTLFADAFPLLLLSEESLHDLNKRLDQPVGMDRFRPNIVISGCSAYAEDEFKLTEVNKIPMRFAATCARCSVPTVNQQTGILSGPEPIHTLSQYRQQEGEIFFGINLIPDATGIINVGDEFVVIA